MNEGNFLAHHHPYEIPYESLLPKEEDCRNLLVPVCLSSSHIAFGSIRMEPVYMILGQSAAAAAMLSLEGNVSLHDLNYERLREVLLVYQALSNEPHRQSYFSSDQGGKTGVMPKHNALCPDIRQRFSTIQLF